MSVMEKHMADQKSKVEKVQAKEQTEEQTPSKDGPTTGAKPWAPRVPNSVFKRPNG